MKTSNPNRSSNAALAHSYGPSLPYCLLEATEIRQIHGFRTRPTKKYELLIRGNYVAGYISCKIRKEARGIIKVPFCALRNVVDLPTELVFERSSKDLRNVLISRESTTLWRQVFQQHPEIPPCPPFTSFPNWVSILFGPATCDKCGHPEAMVDFVFLDRLCDFCVPDHRIYENYSYYIFKVKGIDEPGFRSLIRKTFHRVDAMHYSESEGEYFRPRVYSLEEINEKAKICSAFLLAIAANKPNAEQNYAEFKGETAKFVLDSMRRAVKCNMWSLEIYSNIKREYDDLVGQWKRQLRNLGHHPGDLNRLHRDIHALLQRHGVRKFCKTAFKRSLPAIRKILMHVTGRRLAQERLMRKEDRQTDVSTFYQAHRNSAERLSWSYHPPIDCIYEIGAVSIWIHSELELQFSDDIKEHIRVYVDKYREHKKTHVSQIMRGRYPSLDFEEDPLRLAATVFECPLHSVNENRRLTTNPALVGWDDFDLHFHCIVPKHSDFLVEFVDPGLAFTYNLAGSNTMKHLLGIVGLDLSSTLAEDLDGLRVRVLCIFPGCQEFPHSGKGRLAMTLRECVSHATRNLDHPLESFVLLSDEATDSVILHEGYPPISYPFLWHCGHCSAQARGLRSSVISHVKIIHSIVHPIEDKDYSYIRWKNDYIRKRHWLQLDPPGNYRCNQCHDARKPRLWTYKQVVSHLRDK
ncbi:hypothetical protein GALMADRAFT_1073909 [Galerina marginata CBS 339.88]|uniref:F-box domain-containing protein n=1 Tax=Galerina marginata (strain CBS 339.88) TaxID=685588 RepID=A0A067SLQ1_GALM3|nr:hypothetical protein GALMADRAFT_1073909 [Galerina marginata CBS 339.88]